MSEKKREEAFTELIDRLHGNIREVIEHENWRVFKIYLADISRLVFRVGAEDGYDLQGYVSRSRKLIEDVIGLLESKKTEPANTFRTMLLGIATVVDPCSKEKLTLDETSELVSDDMLKILQALDTLSAARTGSTNFIETSAIIEETNLDAHKIAYLLFLADRAGLIKQTTAGFLGSIKQIRLNALGRKALGHGPDRPSQTELLARFHALEQARPPAPPGAGPT